MTTIIKRFFTTILVTLCILSNNTIIFAKSSEPIEEPIGELVVETQIEIETQIEVETEVTTDGTSFTPDGNLTLVDDMTTEDESSKQFITAVSKSGNYFYLVIDRDADSENVYLLNLVDEADLLSLIEEPIEEPEPEPEPIIIEVEPEPEIIEVEPEPEKNSLMPIIIIIIIAGVGGAFYYLKVIKPKSDDTELTLVDYDDDDDDFYDEEEEEEE